VVGSAPFDGEAQGFGEAESRPRPTAESLPEQVIAFVAAQSGVNQNDLRGTTTLLSDLGIDGDDADDFFTAFAATFIVDLSCLSLSAHFGPEGLPFSWPLHWLRYLFARGTPEQKAGLAPITVADLIKAAQLGRW
jgi:hypothetical protein